MIFCPQHYLIFRFMNSHDSQNQDLTERKYWYENGQLWEQEFYRNGKREGECKIWYESGQLRIQSFWRDGKREGECKEWYENGHLGVQLFYRDGKVEGEHKFWYENGQLSLQFYRDGHVIDPLFNFKKKWLFLRVKKYLHFKSHVSVIRTYIISDLAKILGN